MPEFNLDQSTAIVLACYDNQLRIYSDLDDLRLLVVFKETLGYLQVAPRTIVNQEPGLGIITIVFDIDKKVVLNTNMSLEKTKAVVLKFTKELLEKSLPVKTPGSASTPFLRKGL